MNSAWLALGQNYLIQHLGVTAAVAMFVIVLAFAVWNGFYYQPGRLSREMARTSFWSAWLTAMVTLPLALSLDAGLLDSRGIMAVGWPILVGALVGFFCLMIPVRRRYFWGSTALAIGVVAGLMQVLMP